MGNFLTPIIEMIIDHFKNKKKNKEFDKKQKAIETEFKKNTEESAFAWLELDDVLLDYSEGHDYSYAAHSYHDKFIRCLLNSDKATQRKFVLLSLPENIKGDKGDYRRLDYSKFGYDSIDECVDAIMENFTRRKEYLRENGMEKEIKNLSPFSVDTYAALFTFSS